VGSITVTKTVVGDGPDNYQVELACIRDVDGAETPAVIPGGAGRTLDAGDDFTATYADLPIGAECTLIETDDGGADSTEITPNAGDPAVGVVTVTDGAVVELGVVNTFDPEMPPPPDDYNGTDDGTDLANTGGPSRIFLLAGTILLLSGSGALLLARRRRG
jgi:LPXTG-motif cell wall-anchored protein